MTPAGLQDARCLPPPVFFLSVEHFLQVRLEFLKPGPLGSVVCKHPRYNAPEQSDRKFKEQRFGPEAHELRHSKISIMKSSAIFRYARWDVLIPE